MSATSLLAAAVTAASSNTSMGNQTTVATTADANEQLPPFMKIGRLAGILNVALLVLMMAFGTFGNIMVIAATMVHKVLRTPGNLFVMNLAFADLSVSAFVNVYAIIGAFKEDSYWDDKEEWCFFLGYFCFIVCVGSCWSILLISIARYVALVHHTVYPSIFTWRNSFIMCGAMWVASTLASSTPFVGLGDYGYMQKAHMCLFAYDTGFAFNYYVVLVLFGVPFATIIFCYTKLYLFVRERKAALRKMQNAQQDANAQKKEKNETRLAKTLFIVFLGFMICWTPLAIILMVDPFGNLPEGFYIMMTLFAHISSSGLNFMIYGVTNRQFRDGYMKVIYLITCRDYSTRRVADTTANRDTSVTAIKTIQISPTPHN